MTWKSYHRRGDVLRNVVVVADARRDGILPMDVEGVAETFGDELSLLAALQLRWHTRLAGRIERELMSQPMDLEAAVVGAWREVAAEMPGVRAIIDHYQAEPVDQAMADALQIATTKEHLLLAVMSGLTGAPTGVHGDDAGARVGARVERRARVAANVPVVPAPREGGDAASGQPRLLDRLRAALTAA